MDDEELDRLLDGASKRWRSNGPPLDAIWDGIDEQLDHLRPARRAPGWWAVGIAAAIALVVGVAGGRMSTRTTAGVPVASIAAPSIQVTPVNNDADHRAMGELLGRTAVLLAALPHDSSAAPVGHEITIEGARLLTTTRLLLDSRAGTDPRLRTLLQDLELVLAQVARLQPRGPRVEMQFIQTTLDEHDLVPRLRSAAADLSLDEEF